LLTDDPGLAIELRARGVAVAECLPLDSAAATDESKGPRDAHPATV
jgi:hypothetical protein